MVELMFGDDMVDTLIDNTKPPSGGAYTAVGSYEYTELEKMVLELAAQSDIVVGDLLHTFGRHLAGVFTQKHAGFFIQAGNAFTLFSQIDQHLHVEVKKLYPDAELPKFTYEDATQTTPFRLHYRSSRNLQMLAHGLIEASFDYYDEPHEIYKQEWQEGNEYCCSFEFIPIKKSTK